MAEIPICRLANRKGCDQIGQLLKLRQLGRVGDVAQIKRTAGNQPALRKLLEGDEAVDGEIRRHVVDVVRGHPAGGAVLKDEVVALMLQQADHLNSGHGSTELGIPVEVEVSVSGHDAGRGDLLVPDLGDAPHDLREEGLREEEADCRRVHAEGRHLGVRRPIVSRNARIGRLVLSHRCLRGVSMVFVVYNDTIP